MRQAELDRDPYAERSARDRLRAATRDAHERAERVPVLTHLARGAIDEKRYGAMLTSLAALFSRWENEQREFLRHEAANAGWRYASRTEALRCDLRDLGIATNILPGRLAYGHDRATSWGMLYVVEGSALGGQILAASARRAMPGCTATRFFGIADARDGTWRDFCAVLDAALASEDAIERARRGADAMFARYDEALRAI
jgi:heme oxygenase (biliverdin-IX-beta and delta-forming)